MKDALQFLWAVIRFIPAAIYVIVVGILFYIFIVRLQVHEWIPCKNARDDHHYLDHFDT